MVELGATRRDKQLLCCIRECGPALTAAEAAVASGLPLEQVEAGLLELAVATGAQLRVAESGEIRFVYPPHLRRVLLARSWRLRVRVTMEATWAALFRLIRCAFGAVLIVLVALVSLIVLAVGLLRLDEDTWSVFGQLLGGTLELLVRVVVAVFSDQFWFGSPGRVQKADDHVGPQRVEFLESVYSILFGDGDPNRDLEQRRWQAIGAYLQKWGGVAIAEDLSPLFDLPVASADAQINTDWADQAMLPVLLHFDGHPEVSEQGQLLYRFPALQSDVVNFLVKPSRSFRERRHRFTRASQGQRVGYAVLTALLLVLSYQLLHWSLTLPFLLGVVWVARIGIAYAWLLILVPLLRALVIWRCNAAILARNRLRQSWLAWVESDLAPLDQKRRWAADRRRQRPPVEAGSAYTTEEDLLAQEIDP